MSEEVKRRFSEEARLGLQPEFIKHMNEYIQHPENYPFTTSTEKWFQRFSVPIQFNLEFNFPIKRKSTTSNEFQKFYRKMVSSMEADYPLTVEQFLGKYNLHYPPHPHLIKKGLVERCQYTSTCVKCGKKQIIELQPLAVTKDYWQCSTCGQLHSHKRPGWGVG